MSIPTEANAATGMKHGVLETQPWASLNEERREVLESVCEALAADVTDADRAAACSYLLHHLFEASSAIR